MILSSSTDATSYNIAMVARLTGRLKHLTAALLSDCRVYPLVVPLGKPTSKDEQFSTSFNRGAQLQAIDCRSSWRTAERCREVYRLLHYPDEVLFLGVETA